MPLVEMHLSHPSLRATCLVLAACLAVARPGRALPQVENYPKVALYTIQVGEMSSAERDTVSYYDAVFFMEGPAIVDQIRSRNPDIELYFTWMPQNFVKWDEALTFWYPDTTWSITRLTEFYAIKNDWYLRDTSGNRIPEWDGWAANWTRYCPKGTYGTSKGLTYVEWLTAVAIPQVMANSPSWGEPWGAGSGAYDGVMFEILADCVGSFGWQPYQNADPDRDGLPEGVDAACSVGGWQDSLSVLYREQNTLFHDGLYAALPPNCRVLMNAANKYVNPEWWTDLAGVKLESWMGWYQPAWQDWWDWFYGLRDYNGIDLWGPGYRWAEEYLHHTGDPSEGWDHTLLQVYVQPSWDAALRARMKRFGLGTTLLGDGYFMYTKDQKTPWWQPEYNWDLGAPLSGYAAESNHGGAPGDTLYARIFEKGFVEVNPQKRVLAGVAAQDARFGFWNTITGLAAATVDAHAVDVSFLYPGSGPQPVESVELRYANVPITPESFDQAAAYAGNPVSAAPGTPLTLSVQGLAPGLTYHFAARNRVYGRDEPGISNVASAATPSLGGGGEEDASPPASIRNLAAAARETNRIRLAWTAPGDDGADGTAASYLARYRLGAAITNESEWSGATPLAGLPAPSAAGSGESFWVSGLSPATSYGFAVRAVDEAGNVGGLSNPLLATTESAPPPPPPGDSTPPAAISNLSATAVGEEWVDLSWTAPGDDGTVGTATAYEIRALQGAAIDAEGEWAAAAPAPDAPPTPGLPGSTQTFRFRGLEADQLYGFAVRALDEVGNRGPLGSAFTVKTAAPPPPADEAPPGTVTDLSMAGAGETWIQLRWTASGDDGMAGRATSLEIRALPGRGITTETQWNSASHPPDPLPTPGDAGASQTFRWNGLSPGQTYGFAIRITDDAGNVSSLSPPFTTSTLVPDGPPGTVRDLRLGSADSLALVLHWTAPDDGEGGVVRGYEIGLLAGRAFGEPPEWEEALHRAGPEAPAAPGEAETFTLTGLVPSTLYGIILRARDSSGLVGGLSNSIAAQTLDPPPLDPDPPDTTWPDPVLDLGAEPAGADGVVLRWTAPQPHRAEATLHHYQLHRRRVALDAPSILAATDEEDSLDIEGKTPRPPGEPESLAVARLVPMSRYTFRITAVDDAGERSPAGNSVSIETGPPPDVTRPAPIDDLTVEVRSPRSVRFHFSATGDDGTEGTAARYVIGILEGRVVDPATWPDADTLLCAPPEPRPAGAAMAVDLGGLTPGGSYGVSIRARDDAGNLSELVTAGPIFTLPSLPDSLPPEVVRELRVAARSESTLALSWRAPADSTEAGPAARYVLAYRPDARITREEDWQAALRIEAGLPIPAPPGSEESFLLVGLEPGRRYAIAVRALDERDHMSPLAGALLDSTDARILEPPHTAPPAAILDLRITARGQTSAGITWTAVGEDSLTGRAADYAMRLLLGRPILSSVDWDDALDLRDLPAPAEPGSAEAFEIQGILPGSPYGIAVRARDILGQLSPFVPGAWIEAWNAPPVLDPPQVQNLRVEGITPRSADLAFEHPEVAPGGAALERYEVGISPRAIDPATWDGVPKLGSPPAPGEAGSSAGFSVAPLLPGTRYWIGVRTIDRDGRASALALLDFTTEEEPDLSPPDPPGALRIEWRAGGARLHLSWSPSVDPRVSGYEVYAAGSGDWTLMAETDAALTEVEVDRPDPRSARRFAVRSKIESGVLSGFSPPAFAFAEAWRITGPFPHPIEESCRFEIELPWESEAANLSVAILDISGQHIRRLYEGRPLPGEVVQLAWDRRDEDGDRVGPGYCYLLVRRGAAKETRTLYLSP